MSIVSNLILPTSAFTQRTAPEWFTTALEKIDWRLIVYFNHLRGRWIIDRCTRGITETDLVGGLKHTHDNGCSKTNVLVVRGPNQEYHPLGDDVLEWFRRNDVGSRYEKAEHLIAELTAKDEANREKMRLDRKDNTRAVTLDHKRQLLRMKALADKHNLDVNQ